MLTLHEDFEKVDETVVENNSIWKQLLYVILVPNAS